MFRHPQLASLSSRLATFKDWPEAMPIPKERLAEAGFAYLGEYKGRSLFILNKVVSRVLRANTLKIMDMFSLNKITI